MTGIAIRVIEPIDQLRRSIVIDQSSQFFKFILYDLIYLCLWQMGRLKKEIDPIENALEKIQALEGVSFQWRQDEFPDRWFAQGRQLGLIAQEVEKVLPELVKTDAKGYKSVEYIQLIPVLLEGMKEQQRRLEEQQREINTLKESLKRLLQEYNQDGAS